MANTTTVEEKPMCNDEIAPEITSRFVGYEQLSCASKVSVLTTETQIVESLTDGQKGTLITEENSVLCNQRWTGGRYRCH